MLKNLFQAPDRGPRVPDGRRIYAVGDIHGCSNLLDLLMNAVRAEEGGSAARTRLIFLGDYVDRGPDSRGVVDRLIAVARERPDTVFLKGNHEAALLDFLRDGAANDDWLDWGGRETLESYGVRDAAKRDAGEVAADFMTNLPAAHLAFFNGLELTKTIGDFFFVHAGVRPGVALDAQQEADLLWIRKEFHDAAPELRPPKVIVHGHHPVKKAIDAGWRIAVDTGACFTGRLTAVVLDGDGRRFLST